MNRLEKLQQALDLLRDVENSMDDSHETCQQCKSNRKLNYDEHRFKQTLGGAITRIERVEAEMGRKGIS